MALVMVVAMIVIVEVMPEVITIIVVVVRRHCLELWLASERSSEPVDHPSGKAMP